MNEQWATIELMGHATTAGKLTMESGLVRVDVPEGNTFRTEYYGLSAIYSIKLVSEEISRAFVKPLVEAYEYNTPIVTREQHHKAIESLERRLSAAQREGEELRRRLTSVNALPPGRPEPDPLGFPDGTELDEPDDDEEE